MDNCKSNCGQPLVEGPQKEIPENITLIRNKINLLKGEIAALRDKLSPVLRKENVGQPSGKDIFTGARPFCTEYGGQLLVIVEEIEALRGKVITTTALLEV